MMKGRYVMARVLPPNPNLDHLKNEAKSLLKAHREGDRSVCVTFRRLHRLKDATDEKVLAAEVSLNDAQFALAMDYGFTGWEDLRGHVIGLKGDPNFETEARPGAFLLDVDVSGKKNTNRFGYAYYQSLRSAGAACDYDAIMGDSGLAFILQADSVHTAWGKAVDQLDIGWWPLDGFGADMRLDFLGRASGSKFRALPCDEYRADPKAAYYRGFHGPIVEALQAGRCPVAVEGDIWVVTGYDDGEPPLIGQTSCQEGTHRARVKKWPWGVVIPGEATAALDRREADREALEFGVALIRDALGDRIPPNKLTGCKAFELWARLLRDDAHWGAHFYHGNVVWRLQENRASTVPYLRAMAGRHGGVVASHLETAAGIYEEVIRVAEEMDPGKEVMAARAGREALAGLVDRVAALEAKAAEAMEQATASMKG
jgi:hypothetical protein